MQQHAHSAGSRRLSGPARGNAGRSRPPPPHRAFGSSTDMVTQNPASCAREVQASERLLLTRPQKQGCELKHSINKAPRKQKRRQISCEAGSSTNAALVLRSVLKRSPCNAVQPSDSQQQPQLTARGNRETRLLV